MHAQLNSTTGVSAYVARRAWLSEYFDRTAAAGWAALTSDAPVGFVRRTVRAGRDRMRATLLSWLPADMTGLRVLDAGCGTGAVAVAMAERGAEVVAIDLSPTMVAIARERTPSELTSRITYHAGDMLDASVGDVDYAVAMDSLIHYAEHDVVASISSLAARTRRGILFTAAPRTAVLAVKHGVGRLLPGTQRAPAIEPLDVDGLRARLGATLGTGWTGRRTARVATGFYTSQALELTRAAASNAGRTDAC